ncbi:MAG: Fe-S cluster assembly sulfur transfer protein SufU, partial [Gemmatimonadales bacterium]
MSDLGDLYQQVILDHNRNPRNFRVVPGANRSAEGNNPLCGDRINVFVALEGDAIKDIGFQMPPGAGCAISKASASVMTTAVKGKSVTEAESLFQAFRDMLAGGPV